MPTNFPGQNDSAFQAESVDGDSRHRIRFTDVTSGQTI